MRLVRHTDAIAAADRALAIAEPHDLEVIVAEALLNKGSALGNAGRWREGASLLGTVIELSQRLGAVDIELRARHNLGSNMWRTDQARGYELTLGAHELARRVGHIGHAIWTATVLAYEAFDRGEDWDASIARLDDLLDDASPTDRMRLLTGKLPFLIERGEAVEEVLAEYAALTAGATDPDLAAALFSFEAQSLEMQGGFSESADAFLSAAQTAAQAAPSFSLESGLAAALARDPVRLSAALSAFEGVASRDTSVPALMELLQGYDAALAGATDAARATLDRAFAELRFLGYIRARGELAAVRILPDAPEAPRWAADARVVFERCRAPSYLPWLDEAVARFPDGQEVRSPVSADTAQAVR
jgi:hypothetical protein